MSKTIDLQIEKSRTLIDGLRKNLEVLKDKGFSDEELNRMAADLETLKEASAACDAVREELSQKVKHVNTILESVKTAFAEKKKVIKGYYQQEEWARFGVQDKR